MDRFTTCPTCLRRVFSNRAGDLQAHDVPFTKRRNPKVPQACPTRHTSGQSLLEA
jgi:hypothetical protein